MAKASVVGWKLGLHPITSGVRVIDNVVKVIPTAVWIALGAASP